MPFPIALLAAKGALVGAKGVVVAGHAAAPHAVLAVHGAAPHLVGAAHGLHEQALEAGLHPHVVDALAAFHDKTALFAHHMAGRAAAIEASKAATAHVGTAAARPDVLWRTITVAPTAVATGVAAKATAPSWLPAARHKAEQALAKVAAKQAVKRAMSARTQTDRTAAERSPRALAADGEPR